MENMWQGMGNASQPIGEVNYTPGIDIGEAYMPTEQQLNNLPPDVWHWNCVSLFFWQNII